MDVDEQAAAVAVYLAVNQQANAFAEAIAAAGSARQAFLRLESAPVRQCGSIEHQQWQHALNWLTNAGGGLWLAHTQPITDWPVSLQSLIDPPPLLFWQGNLAAWDAPAVAIVGSRRATTYGLQLAGEFSGVLAGLGLAVISGLAWGIDGAAHQAAIKAEGLTIAVMGCGLDMTYPARHRGLARQMANQSGLLLSEFVPGTPPLKHHFPRRNRIISALSLGVLVVEANANSGSIKTARWALEQGRSVWTVPGSVYSEQSRGCHALLRDQLAELVETPAQLVDTLKDPLAQQYGSQWQALTAGVKLDDRLPPSEKAQRLLDAMTWHASGMDELLQSTTEGPAQLLTLLGELEVLGWIASVPGGYQRIGA